MQSSQESPAVSPTFYWEKAKSSPCGDTSPQNSLEKIQLPFLHNVPFAKTSPKLDLDQESRVRNNAPQLATAEDFETMVGDLRRTFFSWLKKIEGELCHERHCLMDEWRECAEEKKRASETILTQKRLEIAKIHEERRRVENELSLSIKQIAAERQEARKRILEAREHFEKEKALKMHQIRLEEQKVLREKELLKEEQKKIHDEALAARNIIELNVGGTTFETSRRTLLQQPGSLFGAILSGRHSIPTDHTGKIFFDRDSELFRTLLQFLRNPETPLSPRDTVESTALCIEAEYYGIKFYPYALVFALGGHNGINQLSSMEVLDGHQQSWRFCHSLLTARTYFGCGGQYGQLYAFGGQNEEYKALCDVEVYDILRDIWLPAPSLNIPRRNTCGAFLGKRLFCIGGFDGANILASVETYDSRMKNWLEIYPLNVPRSSACCTVIDDVFYAIGGTSGERLKSVERYEDRMNRWVSLQSSLIEVRSAACCTTCLRSIYVFGGTDNSYNIHTSVESLDSTTQEWMFLHSLPEPRMDAASTTVSEYIMLTGGQNDNVLNSSLFYYPETDDWKKAPPMLLPRYGHQLLAFNI